VDENSDKATHQHRHQHRHQADAYRRIEVITGTTRRRRWTAAEKATLVAESIQPDVNVSALARRCGVSPGLLHTWRRKARGAAPVFVPLRIEETSTPTISTAAQPGTLEIDANGLHVRFTGAVDPATLRLVLAHLGRGA
jgi:transposase